MSDQRPSSAGDAFEASALWTQQRQDLSHQQHQSESTTVGPQVERQQDRLRGDWLVTPADSPVAPQDMAYVEEDGSNGYAFARGMSGIGRTRAAYGFEDWRGLEAGGYSDDYLVSASSSQQGYDAYQQPRHYSYPPTTFALTRQPSYIPTATRRAYDPPAYPPPNFPVNSVPFPSNYPPSPRSVTSGTQTPYVVSPTDPRFPLGATSLQSLSFSPSPLQVQLQLQQQQQHTAQLQVQTLQRQRDQIESIQRSESQQQFNVHQRSFSDPQGQGIQNPWDESYPDLTRARLFSPREEEGETQAGSMDVDDTARDERPSYFSGGSTESLESQGGGDRWRREPSGEELGMDKRVGSRVMGLTDPTLSALVKNYIETKNRLELGERTVLILNPRIAQRSYGTEKRFLTPPPQSLLLGASWYGVSYSRTSRSAVVLAPPEVSMTISTFPDSPSVPITTEWMHSSGQMISPQQISSLTASDRIYSGRSVAKALYVSTASDPKRSKVVRVRVQVATKAGPGAQNLGVFWGLPMTVISKPSKKRQSAEGFMTLQHGSLISVYNRIRSQTGTTRFLAIDDSQSSFPASDWKSMTTSAPCPFDPSTCGLDTPAKFLTRTTSWDAFIIYAVDVKGYQDPYAPRIKREGYPDLPPNALPYQEGKIQGIYYNQAIVLQCLSTGIISPIFLPRKITNVSTSIGGGSLDNYTPPPDPTLIRNASIYPSERLGEPVPIFRPVAFEIRLPEEGYASTDRFLVCDRDTVSVSRAMADRTYVSPTDGKTTGEKGKGKKDGSDGSDGGKSAKRRSTISPGGAEPYSKSARPTGKRTTSGRGSMDFDKDGAEFVVPRVWTVDCGDASVWSVCTVDMARHTFYVPPNPQDAYRPAESALYTTPIPSIPIIDNIPLVVSCTVVQPEAVSYERQLVIKGLNFSTSYHIWIGSTPSSHCQLISEREYRVSLPPRRQRGEDEEEGGERKIVVVRRDGVVFPSRVFVA